jgi:hypothetical protein
MHNSKEFWEIIDKAKKAVCTVVSSKSGSVKVYPPNKDLPFYTCHAGERGIHPLRRYLKNTCKISV